MESIAKSEIFFFISTISVGIIAVALTIVLVQTIFILRFVSKTLKQTKIKYLALSKLLASFIKKI